ncbi:MAG: CarD family transcriptional regulator [Spirochaetales bacterium]|nr:CarD family transcriptional regulator [Candidatus Physcosoma equi]
MSSTELTRSFEVGEKVAYPSHGVGKIESKEERNGKTYLKLHIDGEDSVVLLPESNADNLGLRHLATPEVIWDALDGLSDRTREVTADWKQRLTENQNLMKEGTLSAVASVINVLYRRSKVKELPSIEKKLYDTALSALVDEVSSVLNKDQEEVRRIIFSKLEKHA